MTSLLLLKSMLFASVLQKNKKRKKVKTKKIVPITTIDIKMCRICNEEKGEIPIFDNFTHPHIPEEIKNFSGISINRVDDLPKLMCQNCLDLLNGCIVFRDMCQKNNKRMIELTIKKETEANNEEENAHYSDDSFNIPSPAFSEDNSEIWGCTTCNKEFFDMESYNSHLPECNRPKTDVPKAQDNKSKKNFLCDICGKIAKSNANLLIHMGIHENVFPFKCEECPYQGRTMDLLKVHKRTHMADKPFKCTQCPKSTTTSSNLAKHMRHVHSTTRPYKCTYCDKAFSYQHDMKRHIRDIHLRQGTVECDVCFKKFNTKFTRIFDIINETTSDFVISRESPVTVIAVKHSKRREPKIKINPRHNPKRKILQGHRWKIHKIKGERHGRLPSYLQCQQEEQTDNKTNECESIYQ